MLESLWVTKWNNYREVYLGRAFRPYSKHSAIKSIWIDIKDTLKQEDDDDYPSVCNVTDFMQQSPS
jgi:hypothetical protein